MICSYHLHNGHITAYITFFDMQDNNTPYLKQIICPTYITVKTITDLLIYYFKNIDL